MLAASTLLAWVTWSLVTWLQTVEEGSGAAWAGEKGAGEVLQEQPSASISPVLLVAANCLSSWCQAGVQLQLCLYSLLVRDEMYLQ